MDIEKLKALVLANKLGMREIATELGVTVGVVVGKIHRLRKKKELPPALQRAESARIRRKPKKPRVLPRTKPAPLVQVAKPKECLFMPTPPSVLPTLTTPPELLASGDVGAFGAVLKLKSRSCRAPLGDPRNADFQFCCEVIHSGSYCKTHAALYYTPVRTREYYRAAARR